MKSKNALRGISIGVALQLGMLAGSAQTNIYLYSGSETNITLNPGTYVITAYGAPGGGPLFLSDGYLGATNGGLGAEMTALFIFSTPATITMS